MTDFIFEGAAARYHDVPTEKTFVLNKVDVPIGKAFVLKKVANRVPNIPAAYAALTSMVTLVWLLPIFALYPASFCTLRIEMVPALIIVCILVSCDVMVSNVAVYWLEPPLLHGMLALAPVVTLLVESVYQCRPKHPAMYALVLALTCGSTLLLVGAFEEAATHEHQKTDDRWYAQIALTAMLFALALSAIKYVALHAITQSYYRELGSLSLLFWCEVLLTVVTVPWSIESGEMAKLTKAETSTHLWLFVTAALGGLGFLAQLLMLRDLSPTTVALAQLGAQLSAAALAVVIFSDSRLREYSFNSTMGIGLIVIVVCLVLFCLLVLWFGRKLYGPSGGPDVIKQTVATTERLVREKEEGGSPNRGEHGPESFAYQWRNYKNWSPEWSVLSASRQPRGTKTGPLDGLLPAWGSGPRFRSYYYGRDKDRDKDILGPGGYLEAAKELFEQMPASEATLTLSVCMCGYNEEVEEFELTLASLMEQQATLLCNGWRMRVMIGMDGWGAMHASMRQFCREVFPPATYGDWQSELERDGCLGIALRNQNTLFSRLTDGEVGGLDFTMYIKSENRKKDDTLAMFLCGFMIHAMPAGELALLTDAGTAYNRECLLRLINYMETHPRCCGATGRIRVDPECPWDPDRFNNWEAQWTRAAQCSEVELDTIIRYDFTNRIGFMPVLPGPCNMWRMPLISDQFHVNLPLKEDGDASASGSTTGSNLSSAVTSFDSIMTASKQSPDLIRANMRLNEDRVLTLAAIVFSARHNSVTLNWVPDATYFYLAETSLSDLFSQRRRWNNGTLACHVDVLRNIRFYSENRSLLFAIVLWLYAFMEVIAASCGALAPGIVFGAALITLYDLGNLWEPVRPFTRFLLRHQIFIAFGFMVTFVAFVLSHRESRRPHPRLLRFVALGVAFVSAYIVLVRTFWLVLLMATGNWLQTYIGIAYTDDVGIILDEGSSNGILLITAWGSWGLLLTCYVLLSVKNRDYWSPLRFTKDFVLFSLLWMTLRGWFVSAHYSMLHVLTWGNRPDKDDLGKTIRLKSLVWTALILTMNLIAVAGVVLFGLRFELALAILTFLTSAPTFVLPVSAVLLWGTDSWRARYGERFGWPPEPGTVVRPPKRD